MTINCYLCYLFHMPNSSDVLRSQCGMNKSYRPWQILILFIEILCPGKSSEILSDDVLNNDFWNVQLVFLWIEAHLWWDHHTSEGNWATFKAGWGWQYQKWCSNSSTEGRKHYCQSLNRTCVMAQSLLQKGSVVDEVYRRVIFHGKLKDILNGLRRRLKQRAKTFINLKILRVGVWTLHCPGVMLLRHWYKWKIVGLSR